MTKKKFRVEFDRSEMVKYNLKIGFSWLTFFQTFDKIKNTFLTDVLKKVDLTDRQESVRIGLVLHQDILNCEVMKERIDKLSRMC